MLFDCVAEIKTQKRRRNSNWTVFVNNWLEAVYLKQIVPPGILVPRSKFNILDNKFSNFQCKEPVRIRNRDDPTAGQSNIVVSRSPVQIPESANFFLFFFCFL